MMKYGFSQAGVSLTDTLIALAIIGGITSIGIPAYVTQIQKTERNTVQKRLLQYALQQESFRLLHFRYATEQEITMPNSDDYNIKVTNLSEQTFQVIATLKDKAKAKKQCGHFSINQLLERAPKICW